MNFSDLYIFLVIPPLTPSPERPFYPQNPIRPVAPHCPFLNSLPLIPPPFPPPLQQREGGEGTYFGRVAVKKTTHSN